MKGKNAGQKRKREMIVMTNTMNCADTMNYSNTSNYAFGTAGNAAADNFYSSNAVHANDVMDSSVNRSYVRGKVRHYLPIAATVGWLVMWMLGHMSFFAVLGGILIAVGVISALTCCPGKMLLYPILCIAGGFKICRAFVPVYGLGDLIAGIIGLYLGSIVGAIISLGVPAILTIRKWNERCDAAA